MTLRHKLALRRWLAGKLFCEPSHLRVEGRGRGLQGLTARRDAGLATARSNDVVDEARERGDAADEEGGDSTPVASVSGRVAVHTVEVVHVGYGYLAASDNVVAAAQYKWISGYGRDRWRLCGILGDELGHENGCHWTQENGVAAEESKELFS